MKSDRRPHVALMGSRGVPANYGGYETLVEELGVRLVERGWRVTVYCRSHFDEHGGKRYRGMERAVLPTLRTKYLDTPVHTLLSVLHGSFSRFDAVLMVNSANVLFVPWLRLFGTPVALNVDGIEKRRAKWGWPGRLVYALSERLATIAPTRLVTDADVIADHYRSRYGAASTTIAYGVDPRPLPPGGTLESLGLEARKYVLYVSRFEPENNPHRVVEAYASVPGELPLVMVGGAPYANRFVESFTEGADSRVHFPGAIYGEGYRELLSNCAVYIQATEVGGTHPALVEALGYGCCVLANGTPENREVAGDAARYFDAGEPASLAQLLTAVLSEPQTREALRSAGAERARARYSWDAVTDAYERLFGELSGIEVDT